MPKRIRKVVRDEEKLSSGAYVISERRRTSAIKKVDGTLKKVTDGLFSNAKMEMLRACISEGMHRSEIARVMQMRRSELAALERKLFTEDAQPFLSVPSSHRYYTFVLQQEQCIRDLDFYIDTAYENVRTWREMLRELGPDEEATRIRMIKEFPSYQSAIAAVKAKSDIMERVIKMGQELGVIEKRAKELRVSGQLNLAALPTETLKMELQKKLDQLQNLVERREVSPVFRRVIDVQGKDAE